MIRVPDIAQTLDWYRSIGFTEIGRFGNGGSVDWGMVSFGKAELMFMSGKANPQDVRLWFYTTQVDRLYQLFKSRLVQAAQAALAGAPGDNAGIEIIEDIYDPAYGGREFGIRIRLWDRARLLLGAFPYQLLLAFAALRAVWREIRGDGGWEKTSHANAHRASTNAPRAAA